MSQQKVLIALCLVAGLVAVAHGQSFDAMNCGRKLQQYLGDYQKTLTKATENLVSNLQKHTNDAVDISQFSGDLNSMMDEFQSLTNIQSGISATRIVQSWSKIIQLQSSLAMKAFRTSFATGAFSEYSTYTTQILQANSQFVSKMSADCIPTSG